MRFGLAFAALSVAFASACATNDSQAPAGGKSGAGAQASQGSQGAQSAPDDLATPATQGEPISYTLTGADAGLEGKTVVLPESGGQGVQGAQASQEAGATIGSADGMAAPWKSGQAAARVAPSEDHIGDPTRDGLAHRYELRAYGTEVEVYMDGQAVPADRVRLAGQSVGVFDANGVLVERLDLPSGWTEEAQRNTTPDPSDPFDFRDIKGNKLVPPAVMLGGRLVEPSPALLVHLADRGIKRDRVSVVTNVIPDLPLALAGVQNHDIVTAVNEVPDADPETVRAIIRTMKPGESISLRVLRGTETLDFKVTAAAWDPKHMVRRLGAGGNQGVPAPASAPAKPQTIEQLQVDLAAARAEIAALEKQARQKDPVRDAIRPKAEPAPRTGGQ